MTHRGRTIADVLDLDVDAAVDALDDVPAAVRGLTALRDVGLGYLRLGQPATELSGGEAQRIKLATELQRTRLAGTLYVLDEPTTGLHPADVERLLALLQGLVDAGSTVVVVEHDAAVALAADWLVDLGPVAATPAVGWSTPGHPSRSPAAGWDPPGSTSRVAWAEPPPGHAPGTSARLPAAATATAATAAGEPAAAERAAAPEARAAAAGRSRGRRRRAQQAAGQEAGVEGARTSRCRSTSPGWCRAPGPARRGRRRPWPSVRPGRRRSPTAGSGRRCPPPPRSAAGRPPPWTGRS